MNSQIFRAYLIELVGTFGLVFISAGVVCVNTMTLPIGMDPGKSPITGHQPGFVGMALAQGLILAVLLAATMHRSGGFLNPAVTIMLWVFNQLESKRAAWLLGAQFLGGVLAGLCLRVNFSLGVLRDCRFGAVHLNPDAYPEITWGTLFSGAGIELLLTFFLVFAIFGSILRKDQWQKLEEGSEGRKSSETRVLIFLDSRLAGLIAGLTMTAAVLFAFPLTGAALNPARWFGPVFCEWAMGSQDSAVSPPFADAFVYTVGPVLGALIAGFAYFKLMEPSLDKPDKPGKDGSGKGSEGGSRKGKK